MRALLFLSLVSFLLFVASAAAAAPRKSLLVGGWQPIKDIKDPSIQKIAAFAVSEHDMQSGESLTLVNVVSGEQQVVDGFNFRLVIDAKPPTSSAAKYQATVLQLPKGDLTLTSFQRLP